jgi:hypothetical protein
MNKENYFSPKMTTKTDAQLREYVENQSQFQEAAVLAAIWELDKRGKSGQDTQIAEKQIEEKNIKKQEQIKTIDKEKNYTNDPNAPRLFPKWSIWLFSILFAPIFGGVLMAMNFYETKQKKDIGLVLGFSIIFTAVVIYLVNEIRQTTGTSYNITLFLNSIGGLVLDQYFWNIRIGKNLKYRKRSLLIAFIISTVILGFMIWAAITSGEF